MALDTHRGQILPNRLICIVEDDESMRVALGTLVRSLGFHVVEHASAIDFLSPDVLPDISCIITDVQMPGLDGFELIRAVRLRECTAPVIVITGNKHKAISLQAIQSGAFCILQKPFDAEALIEHLHRALGFTPDPNS